MAEQRNIHLVSNAHLDPIWLWQWEEGAAEAIATFSAAADLCEQHEGFVFCHNESLLYEWIERYRPALFQRIVRLVRDRRWHVMGGWFLQPDCNMPSGESFVRQILVGRQYFKNRFGVAPTTAINFDPFGHSRGLVQILHRSGYRSYLFCRPSSEWIDLPADAFRWIGFDGSAVEARRVQNGYNSFLGRATEKIDTYRKSGNDPEVGLVLWGVGNHGGGPSRKDLRDIARMNQSLEHDRLIHSTPDNYFAELRQRVDLPEWRDDINPWAVGCYSSQIRIKQKHRELESTLYSTEKMATTAYLQKLIPDPSAALADAQRDLLLSEFHDVLPGSSIQAAEEDSLRSMDHGLEILSRLRAESFFALASGQPAAKQGSIPLLVYNPHPFKVDTTVTCEFNLPDQNWDEKTFTALEVRKGSKVLPTQCEQEASSINLDWRKRVVFRTSLAPSQMNRFDCRLTPHSAAKASRSNTDKSPLRFRNDRLDVLINPRTGLLDRYRVDGVDYVTSKAVQPIVMVDDADPWGMRVRRFREMAGRFRLMKAADAAAFANISARSLAPVRLIEHGPVRSVVEALFKYESSALVLRYIIPRDGTAIGLNVRVLWQEKDRMLKLRIATPMKNATYLGQVACGVQSLPTNGDEAVAQRWVAVVDDEADTALTCVNNGTYASDFARGELRLTLLRSGAYAAHPIGKRPLLPEDRYMPRFEQGERTFSFELHAGAVREQLESVDRHAAVFNERPMALSLFPTAEGRKPGAGPQLSDSVTQLSAMKLAEDRKGVIVRLFNPTDRRRRTTLRVPMLNVKHAVSLGPFELRTLRIDPKSRHLTDNDLVEGPIRD